MVDFLVRHKLLNSYQHGFLKARSCLTNMLCFLEEITKWIDKGSPVDIIYLDFQKAFDKVPHQRLLLKLKAHDIGDGIIDWIEQLLTDRRQCVVVDEVVSNWKLVLSGVPQVKWSEKWQMLFNFVKCKCLHAVHRNLDINYNMGDTVLGTNVKERLRNKNKS